jgi:photosystem II stability/assembly factor-like uncharacterized protein
MQTSRSKPLRVPLLRGLGWIVFGVWAAACVGEDEVTAPGEPPIWPTGELVAVAAPTPDRVVVVARDGRILRSLDRGETWSRARTPVAKTLSDLVMADAARGWAVGAGTILSTDDGGAHWERQRLPGRASDWDLVAIAALDETRAVAVASDGRWLTTTDGGGHWRGPQEGTAEISAAPTRLVDVACRPTPRALCWAVGNRVVAIDPEREASHGREIGDAAGLPTFRFRFGAVELAEEDVRRLRTVAGGLARRKVDWQVEAFVTREERRRYAEDQDPSALFDRIEARAGEIVGHLEAVGIGRDRIAVVGGPPWGYEEHLDDDPGFLDRYWAARLAPAPSASVRAAEEVDLRAVLVSGAGLVAADGEGRVFHGDGEEAPLVFAERVAPHGLLALAATGPRIVVVGRQGGIFVLRRGRPGVEVAPASVGPGGALFETLRAIVFAPESDVGWAVGDAGRIAVTGDGGHGWRLLEAPKASQAPSRDRVRATGQPVSQADRNLFR